MPRLSKRIATTFFAGCLATGSAFAQNYSSSTIPQVQVGGGEYLNSPLAPGRGRVNPRVPAVGQGDGRYGRRGDRPHDGIDLPAPVGTPVVAPVSGWLMSDEARGYGYRVLIRDAHGRTHLFGHLDAPGPIQQTYVEAGQVIGHVGRTGNVPAGAASHLHYEVRGRNDHSIPLESIALPGVDAESGALENYIGSLPPLNASGAVPAKRRPPVAPSTTDAAIVPAEPQAERRSALARVIDWFIPSAHAGVNGVPDAKIDETLLDSPVSVIAPIRSGDERQSNVEVIARTAGAATEAELQPAQFPEQRWTDEDENDDVAGLRIQAEYQDHRPGAGSATSETPNSGSRLAVVDPAEGQPTNGALLPSQPGRSAEIFGNQNELGRPAQEAFGRAAGDGTERRNSGTYGTEGQRQRPGQSSQDRRSRGYDADGNRSDSTRPLLPTTDVNRQPIAGAPNSNPPSNLNPSDESFSGYGAAGARIIGQVPQRANRVYSVDGASRPMGNGRSNSAAQYQRIQQWSNEQIRRQQQGRWQGGPAGVSTATAESTTGNTDSSAAAAASSTNVAGTTRSSSPRLAFDESAPRANGRNSPAPINSAAPQRAPAVAPRQLGQTSATAGARFQ